MELQLSKGFCVISDGFQCLNTINSTEQNFVKFFKISDYNLNAPDKNSIDDTIIKLIFFVITTANAHITISKESKKTNTSKTLSMVLF